jgi:hypothetical protein
MEMKLEEKKIEDYNLEELVKRIKRAGYAEAFGKEIRNKTWQIYTKEEKDILKVIYLNDSRELFTTQVFKKEDTDEERYDIESVIENYLRYDTSLLRVKKDYSRLWLWILIGAVSLGALTRRLTPAIVGGIAGAIACYLYKLGKIYDLRKEKLEYEKGHNIKFGPRALEEIS